MEEGFVCKYCKKSFKKESTLFVHMCEKKLRFEQKDEPGVRLGFMTYQKFYEYTQGSAKTKTYDVFVESPYYNAFIKFGRYMIDIKCVNSILFAEYVIKSGKKLDYWCKDSIYDEWLYEYLRRERADDTLDRAFSTMQKWSDNHPPAPFNHYFIHCNKNIVMLDIAAGRISPWLLYNCDTGLEFLGKLSDADVNMVYKWIDPPYWQKHFSESVADTEFIKNILKQAKL
jgi:hypothetical protein